VNTSERGAPPSRAPAGPAGPRGPRRLEPAGDAPDNAGPDRNATPDRNAAPARNAPAGRNAAPARNAPAGSAVLGGTTPSSRGPRRLAPPKPVRVRADEGGRPRQIGGRAVEAVRESWLVEDRWWTPVPVRRRYWEVVTADGRNVVVYRDLVEGGWFAQR
jgi:hypothetical protein